MERHGAGARQRGRDRRGHPHAPDRLEGVGPRRRVFSDPLIDDKASKRRYRADQLVEGHVEKLRKKGKDDQAEAVYARLVEALNADDAASALGQIIQDEEIRSPDSGAFDWTEVRQFNLMFETATGALAEEASKLYLRPETAQGIFVHFKDVAETARQQVPFGIAQVGKAFRNEIVARQFIFRMREFEQMEMQYFVKPGEQMEAYAEWSDKRMAWHVANGIRKEKLRWHGHEKLAHYADAAQDVQYEFPFGWNEVEGVHSRTDFDLSRHQEFSGKKLEYFDPQSQERYVPYVVETSVGLDRTILMVLCDAYAEEEVASGDKTESRTVLRFHPALAPFTAAVFPLVKKDGMPEAAHRIEADLRRQFNVTYDEKGAVGRRYRRQDEVGHPVHDHRRRGHALGRDGDRPRPGLDGAGAGPGRERPALPRGPRRRLGARRLSRRRRSPRPPAYPSAAIRRSRSSTMGWRPRSTRPGSASTNRAVSSNERVAATSALRTSGSASLISRTNSARASITVNTSSRS